jgi:hypothetical protein
MNLYEYTAIIAKNSVIQGNVTFTDRRSTSAVFEIPLRSTCIADYVLAESPEHAKELAIADIKKRYPHEQGFRGQDNICIRNIISSSSR